MRLRYSFLITIVTVFFLLKYVFTYILGDDYRYLIPTLYHINDPVELIVNKVESDLTQLPYAYYDLPFTCPPTFEKKPLHLSLNEIIRGDRKWESDYKLFFGKDNDCEVLCARKTKKEGMESLKKLIEQGYVVQWSIDNDLPASTTFISTTDNSKYYASGFPLGYVDEDTGKIYLNNHVMLVIRYHAVDDYNFTIVGFEVYPKSVSDYHCPGASRNYEHYEVVVPDDPEELTFLPFTYSVYWREEFDLEWKDRHNLFFHSGEVSKEVSDRFHWISLLNSLGIAFLTTFIVVLILIKIHSDNNKNKDTKIDSTDENSVIQDTSLYVTARSWFYDDKSPMPHILIFLTSMGIQFLFTIVGSLIISCSINKLNDIRHTVLSMALLFFIIGGFMASYIGTTLAMQNNKLNARRGSLKNLIVNSTVFPIVCGSLLPGLLMFLTIGLNSIIWLHDSTTALPFKTIVQLMSIYFIVCIPLSIAGGQVAKKFNSIEYPRMRSDSIKKNNLIRVKKSLMKDSISPKSMKNNFINFVVILLSGLLPFIIIYVELQYVYKTVWLEKTTFYYLYGFLLANIILLCFVTCEISIIGIYLMMNLYAIEFQNTWRWKIFQLSSNCAWYMEVYSLYYVFKVLNIRGFSSIFLSVCYSLLFNALCGLALGSLGYLMTNLFIERIFKLRYSA